VTLASGFLSAGAQRVVASHWHVHDQATAELMEVFFARLTEDAKQGRTISFARALQESRLHLRQQAGRAAPFYWAPFVLIGPPELELR
jgi:CHAT domain-containing protein